MSIEGMARRDTCPAPMSVRIGLGAAPHCRCLMLSLGSLPYGTGGDRTERCYRKLDFRCPHSQRRRRALKMPVGDEVTARTCVHCGVPR